MEKIGLVSAGKIQDLLPSFYSTFLSMLPPIGCFGITPKDDAKRSKEIDRMLLRDEKVSKKVVKVLLLGAGESGKSTILKQMRLIYTKEGFTKQEKEECRGVIFNNILDGIRIALDFMEGFDIKFQDPSAQSYASIIQNKDNEVDEAISIKQLTIFKTIWNDPGFQTAIESGKLAANDNLQYFFNDIDRLFNKDFIPTNQDILRARLQTTGITENIFNIGSQQYRIFDVGGQRSERKKWIHCFENVNALIFLVALSGYDQCLAEDVGTNQIKEALFLWDSIANSHWFKSTCLILFLNKIDLFKNKVAKNPITSFGFSDFSGNTSDWKETSRYFRKNFVSLNRSSHREIYSHFTNATDTNLLRVTMTSVQDMIIQKNLHKHIL